MWPLTDNAPVGVGRGLVALVGCAGCLAPQSFPPPTADQLGAAQTAVWFVDTPKGVYLESQPIEALAVPNSLVLTPEASPELWLYPCPVAEVLSPRQLLLPGSTSEVCTAGGAPCPARALRFDRPSGAWALETTPAPRPWPERRPSACAQISDPRSAPLIDLARISGRPAFLVPLDDQRLLVGGFDYPEKIERGLLWVWSVPSRSEQPAWTPAEPMTTTGTVGYFSAVRRRSGELGLLGTFGRSARLRERQGRLEVTPDRTLPIEAWQCPRSCTEAECIDRCAGDVSCRVTCGEDPGGCTETTIDARSVLTQDEGREVWWVLTPCRVLLARIDDGPWRILRAREPGEVKVRLPYDLFAASDGAVYAAGMTERGVVRVDARILSSTTTPTLLPEATQEGLVPATALGEIDGVVYGAFQPMAGAFLYRRSGSNWIRGISLGSLTDEVLSIAPVPGGLLGATTQPGLVVQARPSELCREEGTRPALSTAYELVTLLPFRERIFALMTISVENRDYPQGLLAVFEATAPSTCTRLGPSP